MYRSTVCRAVSAVAAAVIFAACGDSTTGPQDGDVSASVAAAATVDVATVAGDAASEDVQLFKLNAGAFGFAQLSDYERFERWNGCPYDATAKRFICEPKTRGGFVHTRSYAFLDQAGVAQTSYSAATTAQANFRSSLSGTISRNRWSGTMSRERDVTLSGLFGDNASVTINGRSATEKQRTRFEREAATAGSVDRTYDLDATLAITNVVVGAARLPDTWPASGTITRNYSLTRVDVANGTRATTRTSVVTFNGTQFVPLVVNGTEFTLDLATGTVVRK